MTGQLPDDAITAEAIEAFTVGCAKASSVPGATAGDCYRAGLAAALPALTVAAIAAERERILSKLTAELDRRLWLYTAAQDTEGLDALFRFRNILDSMLGGTADGAHTPGGAT